MSRLNIEQFRTFLAVVRLGGMRKAAHALNLTQPAVTARIKNLESSLACELFERTAAGIRLTKRGELLFAHAEKFEHLTDLIDRDVVDPAGIEGHLRIGASETVAQCWLPNFVSRLHAQFPNLEIEFNVDISLNLRDGLLRREIDLAFLLGPVSEYSVDNVALPGFELAWYASTSTPSNNTAEQLLKRPVLTYARHTRPFRELKALLFEKVGPNVPMFPSSSLSACFRLVEADLGVAVLPRALGAEFVEKGSIREFDPGWVPEPLQFTASFLGEPKSHLLNTAANIAKSAATDYLSDRKV